jgi:predicted HicB family RNase H-like nuclease
MDIQGYKAVISYDPDIALFRGEFVDLNGSADFYAADVEGLKREGEISLKVFLDVCREQGLEPRKTYSGKFNVRIPAHLHANIVTVATAQGKSLNQWITEALSREISIG